MSRSGWTWHNLWNFLLTINFKYKYFHNSVDWSGFIFKCISLHDCQKFQDYIQSLDYWKMHLWNSPTLGMIWLLIPHVERPPKNCPLSSMKSIYKKVPPFFWGKTLCPCSTGKSCGDICSLNICKEMRTKTC